MEGAQRIIPIRFTNEPEQTGMTEMIVEGRLGLDVDAKKIPQGSFYVDRDTPPGETGVELKALVDGVRRATDYVIDLQQEESRIIATIHRKDVAGVIAKVEKEGWKLAGECGPDAARQILTESREEFRFVPVPGKDFGYLYFRKEI